MVTTLPVLVSWTVRVVLTSTVMLWGATEMPLSVSTEKEELEPTATSPLKSCWPKAVKVAGCAGVPRVSPCPTKTVPAEA
jgi:hypothetical protein